MGGGGWGGKDDFVSKAAQNCCFVYSLGGVFHLLLFLLRSSGPSHSVVAASRKTAERGTLDRKKIFTLPICHPPCSTHLTGTREGMWGSGVKKNESGEAETSVSPECLFNILIGNDKHSGAFSPTREIKELELREMQHYGS